MGTVYKEKLKILFHEYIRITLLSIRNILQLITSMLFLKIHDIPTRMFVRKQLQVGLKHFEATCCFVCCLSAVWDFIIPFHDLFPMHGIPK